MVPCRGESFKDGHRERAASAPALPCAMPQVSLAREAPAASCLEVSFRPCVRCASFELAIAIAGSVGEQMTPFQSCPRAPLPRVFVWIRRICSEVLCAVSVKGR